MKLHRFSARKTITAAAAACLAFAAASPAVGTPPPQVDPLVAVSLFASPASQAALCGSSALAGAAATVQGAAPGCVLPRVDPPVSSPAAQDVPPPPASAAAIPAGAAVAGAGLAVLPLLFGLFGVAGATVALLTDDQGSLLILVPNSPT
jgi:hypothetical protein